MLKEAWGIQLLGGLTVSQNGQAVPRFRTQKAAGILSYLAFYSDRIHSRDSLIELFWPDLDVDSGRNNLRQALFSLRRQLEPAPTPAGTVMVGDSVTIRLNPEAVWVDTGEFEDAAKRAGAGSDPSWAERGQRAVELYRGPLLWERDEAWISPERGRLGELYIGVLRRLIRHFAEVRDFDQAVDLAHRLVAAEPTREDAHRALIKLHIARGNPAAAVHQFRELERILKEEGVTASSATTQLIAGLAAPEPPAARSFRSGAASALGETPSTAGRRLSGIPIQFTRFFGRESEIETIRRIVVESERKLITLTGPGGSGKTRLAIEAARGLTGPIIERTWFIPFADVCDPTIIPDVLARVLGIKVTPHAPSIDGVIDYLRQSPSLLVLDNFEQLAPEGAGTLSSLRSQVENLHLVVTSRRTLNLAGEQELVVGPLPTPADEAETADLLESPSVALFVDRSRLKQPDFHLSNSNARTVAELCRRLEGIPLAIELAAAKIRTFSPGQILERIDERLELLATRRADREGRHRSLRAAISWSYEMLPAEQQRLFSRLAVFRGGFGTESASYVALDNPDAQAEALDLLDRLRSQSLLLDEPTVEGPRYRLLDSLREFGWEQLSGQERAYTERQHAEYFGQLAATADAELRGPSQDRWIQRLQQEHDNLRAAMDRSEAAGELGTALRIAADLGMFWYFQGHFADGRARLERLLNLSRSSEPEVRAKALKGAGGLAYLQGDYGTARRLQEEAIAIRQQLNDPVAVASSLGSLGNTAKAEGRYDEAVQLHEKALAIYRSLGDESSSAMCLMSLGFADYDLGNYVAARMLTEQAIAIQRSHEDVARLAGSLSNLAMILIELGDYAGSIQAAQESLKIRRELGDRWGIAVALDNLGMATLRSGDPSTARTLLEDSLRIRRELVDAWGVAAALGNLATVAFIEGDRKEARRLRAESLSGFAEVRDLGAIAEELEGFAALAAEEGDARFAPRLLGAADEIRKASGRPRAASQREQYERTLSATLAALGEESFRPLFDEGRKSSWETAVREAREWAP